MLWACNYLSAIKSIKAYTGTTTVELTWYRGALVAASTWVPNILLLFISDFHSHSLTHSFNHLHIIIWSRLNIIHIYIYIFFFSLLRSQIEWTCVWTVLIWTYCSMVSEPFTLPHSHTYTNHATIHPHYTNGSFHNLYLFKIQHLCHLMKWLSSLHHEKSVCIWTVAHPSQEQQKIPPEIPKEVNSTHTHTVQPKTNDFVCWTCSNEERAKRKRNRIDRKKKPGERASRHTLFQKKAWRNMRKIIYNGIGNSDNGNEIRITTHWRKLNLHFFTINCKKEADS